MPLVAPVGGADGERVGIVLGKDRNAQRQGVSHQFREMNISPAEKRRQADEAMLVHLCRSGNAKAFASLQFRRRDRLEGQLYRAIDRGLDADRGSIKRFHIRRDDVGPEIDLDRADMFDADLDPKEKYGVRHELEHDAGAAGSGMARLPRRILNCFAHQTVSRQAGDDMPRRRAVKTQFACKFGSAQAAKLMKGPQSRHFIALSNSARRTGGQRRVIHVGLSRLPSDTPAEATASPHSGTRRAREQQPARSRRHASVPHSQTVLDHGRAFVVRRRTASSIFRSMKALACFASGMLSVQVSRQMAHASERPSSTTALENDSKVMSRS